MAIRQIKRGRERERERERGGARSVERQDQKGFSFGSMLWFEAGLVVSSAPRQCRCMQMYAGLPLIRDLVFGNV